MRNNSFIFCVLLFVDDVFGVRNDGVKSVLVMEGDCVILHTGDIEVKRDETIMWMFGDEEFLMARINKADGIFYTSDDDKRFSNRLELDKQTLSLTIRNINTNHSGLYKLQSTAVTLKIFRVTVRDVVETLSVMEGDYVTLHTGVTKIQKDDLIQWFGDQGALITHLNDNTDERWRDIFDLNYETGDLTIRNIRSGLSVDYEVKIKNNGSMTSHRKFLIIVNGIFCVNGVKTTSVMEGNSVTLQTRITDIPSDDVIEWTFGPQNISIVKIDRENATLFYNEHDVRFTDKLHLNIQTGDLTISNTKTEDSGLYQIKIIKSSSTIQKSFSVTVSASDLHPGYIALICVCLVLVPTLVALMIYSHWRDREISRNFSAVSVRIN